MRLLHWLGRGVRTDLGVRTFQGLGKNSPTREQVVRRTTRDLHTHRLIESLACESCLEVPLHRRCLPDCIYANSVTRDIETTLCTVFNQDLLGPHRRLWITLHLFFLGGGGVPPPFQKLRHQSAAYQAHRPCCPRANSLKMLKRRMKRRKVRWIPNSKQWTHPYQHRKRLLNRKPLRR